MKKFILLILVCMLSSCSVAITRGEYHTKRFTNARVFQVLDSNDALIWDDDFNVAKIVTIEEIYYEGLKISGRFILVDTYAYETRAHQIKVVPVYVRLSEYNKYSK